jgi:Tfp pilus assembly protein PilX
MSAFKMTYAKLRSSQSGTISIMTTMVLMIVITLIVLGFAQVSRRTQRESLDRQLSSQSFYAAESGINDIRDLIHQAVNNGTAVPDKTGCTDTGPGGFYATLNPTIDAGRGVSYSCALVDASPTILRYSDVGTTSVIVPMTSASGANFSTVKLSLQSKLTGTPITGCPASANNAFKTTTNWTCGYGVLRFDLVPTAGNGLTADSLRNSTMTTFAVPVNAGGVATIPYIAGTANTNNRIGMQCNNAGCNLTITGLSQNSYYLRVTSLYQDVAMQVTGTVTGGVAAEIAGAQAAIDVTGKSQDVLRRIQVNVPIHADSKNQLSDYALESTDSICKRYSVMDGYFDSGTADVISSNRLCQP